MILIASIAYDIIVAFFSVSSSSILSFCIESSIKIDCLFLDSEFKTGDLISTSFILPIYSDTYDLDNKAFSYFFL